MDSMGVDLVSFFETQEKLQNEESEDEANCDRKVMKDLKSSFEDAVREEDPESHKALRVELEAEYHELYAKAGEERDIHVRLRESSQTVELVVAGLKPDTTMIVDDTDSPRSKRKAASGESSGSGKRARLGPIPSLEPRRSPRLAKKNAAVVVRNVPGSDKQERLQTPSNRQTVVQEKSWSQATTVSHISVEDAEGNILSTKTRTPFSNHKARQTQSHRKRVEIQSPSAGRESKRRAKAPTSAIVKQPVVVSAPSPEPEKRARTKGRAKQSATKKTKSTVQKPEETAVAKPSNQVAKETIPVAQKPKAKAVKVKPKMWDNKPAPQILSGLTIVHLPWPRNVTPKEKHHSPLGVRLAKMIAHGATFTMVYDSTVTHIIVAPDNQVDGDVQMHDYSQVKKFLHLGETEDVPIEIPVVDQWYLEACYSAGRVLPPGDGSRSQVSGKFKYGDNKLGYRIAGHMERVKQVAAQKEIALKMSVAESKISEADVADIEEPPTPETPPGEVPDSQPLPLGEPVPIKTAAPLVQNSKSPTSKTSPVLRPIAFGRPTSQRETLELVKKGTGHSFNTGIARELRKKQRKSRPTKLREDEYLHKNSPQQVSPQKETDAEYWHYRRQKRSLTTAGDAAEPTSSDDRFEEPPQGSNDRTKPSQPRDALDEVIEEASKGAPEHDESADDHDSRESREHRAAKRTLVRAGSTQWQDTFACMHGRTAAASDDGPNAMIIAHLTELSEYYERIKEPWKGPAYRKAINAIRAENSAIMTKEQALGIRGVRDRLAAKIVEIATTQKLRRLEHAKSDGSQLILQGFLQVYGAGLQVAQGWIAKGYKTLDDLRMRADLTGNQRIGVDHYDDFLARIPREEVSRHENHVRMVVEEVSDQLEITVGGSYRRGAPTCGDVDFLITSKADSMSDDALRMLIFDQLIPRLESNGYIKAALATSSSGHGSKWHGAAALPATEVWRRVDFLMVPWREWGAALLYFTGNDIFNRSIRLLASKKKMRLNQHGLYQNVLRGLDRQKLNEGTLVESRDEKRIFEALGVPYRPPEERAIG